MDDVAEFFKNGFMNLHKNKIDKNYQQKTLKDRINMFDNIRRETRNTLMFQKRNINENMTPLNTPEPSKIVKNMVQKKERKTNKRLEMLNQWKAEKEKRKQEEKQKMKPLFKVCHVPLEVGLPNLEKVNKEIKGKPISQFAPTNHTFHAPKNIKPIHVKAAGNNSFLNKSEQNKKSNFTREAVTKQASTVSQTTTRRTTRSHAVESAQLPKRQNDILPRKQTNKTLNGNKNAPEINVNKKKSYSNANNNREASKPKQSSTLKHSATTNKTEITTEASSLKSISNTKCSPPKKNKKNPKVNSAANNKTEVIAKASSSKNFNTQRSPPKKSKKNAKVDGCRDTKNDLSTPVNVNEIYLNKSGHETSQDLKGTHDRTRKAPKKNKICFEDINMVDSDKKSNTETPKELRKKAIKTTGKTRKSINDTPKKNIGWNIIEIIDSDEEILSKDINNKTPKASSKKYNKTPRKNSRKINSFDDTKTEETLKDIDETIKNIDTEEQDSPMTPKNKLSKEVTPVYISPFVTVSRGKSSARKEYEVRHSASIPNTPDFNKNISSNTSPKAGAEYFSKKLDDEITRIEEVCRKWNTYREENTVPEEANDMINVAVGQSKLLISKKFQQFRSLIEQCRSNEYVEKPISCKDLHGFWDMMYMQVEDLNKRFNNLDNLRANNWEEVLPEKKTVVKRGRGRPKKTSGSSSLKNFMKAAREKKKLNKDTDKDTNQFLDLECNDTKVFSGGYYSIKSPVSTSNIALQSPAAHPNSGRRSLRVSLLAHQVKNRISSPGLTMMKVSQAIKRGDGLTPGKSILKNDLTKSATKMIKSVLFKDDLEEDIENSLVKAQSSSEMDMNKENDLNEVNMITFSPCTLTRRSRRLSKLK